MGNAIKFKLPLTTLFLDWAADYPVQKLIVSGYIPFVAVTSGFSWMSAAAHFTVLLFFNKIYIPDLRRGMNRFRWIEYAFSSSLMIGLIAMLFGMYDIISLVLLMSVNATVNLFGFLMETTNVNRKKCDWTPFYFGGQCSSYSVPSYFLSYSYCLFPVHCCRFSSFDTELFFQCFPPKNYLYTSHHRILLHDTYILFVLHLLL